MKTETPFKRLIPRAVLRKLSPTFIRILAVPDHLDLPSFDEVVCSLLGWDGLGFSFHIHGQELAGLTVPLMFATILVAFGARS